MEKKINLEEIIEKHRLDTDHYADQDFDESCIEKICLEFGEQLLKLASENTSIVGFSRTKPAGYEDNFNIVEDSNGLFYFVYKQSIIDTIKQVE